uniref:Immunoglobulin V-set domain-containing protein n=1 Tax=Monopterus albus TaxID=43700 RepID=A0A3Q3R0G6_MONAL
MLHIVFFNKNLCVSNRALLVCSGWAVCWVILLVGQGQGGPWPMSNITQHNRDRVHIHVLLLWHVSFVILCKQNLEGWETLVYCVFQVQCSAQVRDGAVEVTVSGLKATDTDLYRCDIEVFYPPPYLHLIGNDIQTCRRAHVLLCLIKISLSLHPAFLSLTESPDYLRYRVLMPSEPHCIKQIHETIDLIHVD